MRPCYLRLITSQDRRLAVEQIKKHPFFYGVDWNAIRQIEAPFIPRLRSITDTSYFPTEELDQVPDEPSGGDTTGAHKELAFLGYVHLLRFEHGTDVGGISCFLSNSAIRSRGSRSLRTLSDLLSSRGTFISSGVARRPCVPFRLYIPQILNVISIVATAG